MVHGVEFFFGSGGIEKCTPGGTMLGQPLKKELLGQTNVDLSALLNKLSELGANQFAGHRYIHEIGSKTYD